MTSDMSDQYRRKSREFRAGIVHFITVQGKDRYSTFGMSYSLHLFFRLLLKYCKNHAPIWCVMVRKTSETKNCVTPTALQVGMEPMDSTAAILWRMTMMIVCRGNIIAQLPTLVTLWWLILSRSFHSSPPQSWSVNAMCQACCHSAFRPSMHNRRNHDENVMQEFAANIVTQPRSSPTQSQPPQQQLPNFLETRRRTRMSPSVFERSVSRALSSPINGDRSAVEEDNGKMDDPTAASADEEQETPETTVVEEENGMSTAMIASIGFYKNVISPLLPPACRFVPTCSQYGVQAIKEFGSEKGVILIAWRILRCSPFGGKGYDPPQWPPVSYTHSSY